MYSFIGAGLLLFVLANVYTYTETVIAAPNLEINYQGKLTDSSNVAVPDGTYNMRFWLTSSPSVATTSALWTESLTTTNRVQVTNGLFSVMLGSTSPLTGVDFNQTLYLGVEIGATTTTPVWDGEMSPRKVLGAVPAAFESSRLDGLDSLQFARTDATSSIATSSTGTLLTITQNGTGDILNLFDGSTEVLTVLDGGNVGIGTTTPSRRFTVQGGDVWFGGNVTGTGTLTVSGLTTLGYASSTGISGTNFNFTSGTTTNLAATGSFKIGSDVITDITGTGLALSAAGVLSATGDGISNWIYNGSRLSPSTTVGIGIFASSTIGNGTAAGGLTVYGNSTTTLAAYVGTTLGIGTTSPNATLTLRGTGATNPLMIASSSGSSLLTVQANGNIGIGTSTPTALLALTGSATQSDSLFRISNSSQTILLEMLADGSLDIGGGGIYYDAGTNQTSIANLSLGTTNFDTDGGVLSWVDLGIESAATSTAQSYTATIDSNPVLTVYGESNGQGGAMNLRVGIASSTPSRTLTVDGEGFFTNNVTFSSTTITNALITNATTTNATSTYFYASNLTASSAVLTAFLGTNATVTNATSTNFFATNLFGTNSFLTNATIAGLLGTNATITNATTTTLAATGSFKLGSDVITDITGSGLSLSATGVLSSSGDGASNWIYNGSRLAPSTTVGIGVFASSTIGGGTGITGLTVNGSATTTGRLTIGTDANTDIFINSGSTTLTNSNNVVMGNGAFTYRTAAATHNTALGYQALYGSSTVPMTGDYNFAVGYQSLYRNTTGSFNNAIGVESLFANTTGSYNNALGPQSLFSNTTGSSNNALGASSLIANTTGSNNNALGFETLLENTTGSSNNALGYHSLYLNTTGSYNNALGYQSLQTNSTGSYNNALGNWSLFANTTGSYNNAFGLNSGDTISTGWANTFLGASADATGDYSTSTAIGAYATVGCSNCMVLGGTGVNYTRVGIGTTTPSRMLTVIGDIYTPNNITAASGTISYASSTALTVSGNTWLTYASSTAVSGTNLNFTNATTTSLVATGFLKLGSDHITDITGTNLSLSAAGVLSATGDGISNWIYNGSRLSPSTTVGIGVFASSTIGGGTGATGLTINGSATTTESLVVGYRVLARNNSLAGGYGGVEPVYASGVASFAWGNAGVSGGAILASGSGSAAIGIGNLSATNNGSIALGFGDANSGGNILSSGYGSFAGGHSGTNNITASGAGSFAFGDNVTASGNYATAFGSGYTNNTANTFQVGYSSTPTFTVNVNGVGIGTTTPSRMLTVIGDIYTPNNITAASGTISYASSTALTVSGNTWLTYASSTGISGTNLNFTNATTTSLVATGFLKLGSDHITDITGTNLSLSAAGVLSATGDGISNWIYNGSRLSPSTTVGIGVFASSTIGGGTGITGLTVNGSATTTGRLTIGTNANTDIFINSGSTTLTAAGNVAIGNQALTYFTTGATYNTALGYQALFGSSTVPMTGDHNLAVGYQSLFSNTTGTDNNALGQVSLYSNTTGSKNNAFGYLSLYSNTTGTDNNALGYWSLAANTTGSSNNALGANAGDTISTGWANTFLGAYADATTNNLSTSTAIGAYATVGCSNCLVLGGTGVNYTRVGIGTTTPSRMLTVIGDIYTPNNITAASGTISYASSTALTVSGNTWLTYASSTAVSGTNLNFTNATTTSLVATGFLKLGSDHITDITGTNLSLSAAGVLSATGDGISNWIYNGSRLSPSTTVGIGVFASSTIGGGTGITGLTVNGSATTTGRLTIGTDANTDIFINSGSTTLTNSNNVAIGNQALSFFATGATDNTAIGYQALFGSSTAPMTGDFNFAVGYQSLYRNITGSYNNALGNWSLFANTIGSYNNALGQFSLYANTIGSNNNALGQSSLVSNTIGSNNNALGSQSLAFNTTGSNNNALGYWSLNSNTTGSHNNALGQVSLFANTTGNNNIALGYQAGDTISTGSGNTFLGADTDATTNNLSTSTAIGAYATVGCSNCLVLGGTGVNYTRVGIGTTTPSRMLTVIGDIYTPNNITAASGTISYASSTALTVSGNTWLTYASSTGISGTNLNFTNATTTSLVATGFLKLGSDHITDITGTNLSLSAAGVLSATGDGISNWIYNGSRLAPSTTVGIGVFASSTIGGGTGATGLTISGNSTTTGSVVVGYYNVLASNNSLAGGIGGFGPVQASGVGSFAWGNALSVSGASIIASGGGSAAIGYGNLGATAAGSIAVGYGDSQFGGNILSSASGSFAGGYASINNVTASGAGSFAFGDNVTASGNFSTAFGSGYTNNTANTFQVGYSSTPTFTVNVNGVGIGTTTPSRMLTVIGDIYTPNNITAASGTISYASSTALTVSGNTWLTYASSTGISGTNLNFTNATTTSLVATGFLKLGSDHITDITGTNLSLSAAGVLSATGDGISNWIYNGSRLAPSTTVGIGVFASSTIGGGTGITGLTVNGSATTTGRLTIGTNANTDIFINSGSTTLTAAGNVAIGNQALTFFTTGATYNTAIGYQALFGSSTAAMTGDYNFAVGYQSLYRNTTGSSNNALGYSSLLLNTTGLSNNALGNSSLYSNTTGSSNNALGYSSLSSNTTGSYNNALGEFSLFSNTTGSDNNALGANAGDTISTGYSNTFLGAFADATANNLSTSTAIGAYATVGCSNCLVLGGTGVNYTRVGIGTTTPSRMLTVIGDIYTPNNITAASGTISYASSTSLTTTNLFSTLASTTYASSTALSLYGSLFDRTGSGGTNGMVLQTTGSGVTWVATSSLGFSAGSAADGVSNWLYNGSRLSPSTTVGIGVFASSTIGGGTGITGLTVNGSATTTGRLTIGTNANTDIFINSGSTTLTNSNNVAMGNGALTYFTTGATYNTALGYQALRGSSTVPMTGDYNFAVGYQSLFANTTGSYNNALGNSSLAANTTGTDNNALGYLSLVANTTGSYNNALGNWSLVANTTGRDNNALGYQSLFFNTIGSNNNALGGGALYANTTGSHNNAFGLNAGDTISTGWANIFLGANSDATTNNLSTSTAIGAYATVGCSNCMVLGGTGVNYTRVGIGTTTPSRMLTVIGDIYTPNNITAASGTISFASSTALTVSGNTWLTYASSTGISGTNLNFTNATTTSLVATGFLKLGSDHITDITGTNLSLSAAGVLSATGDGISNWIYNGSRLAPSTTVGIGVFASSTIGGGTGITGLTVNGSATTTGRLTIGTNANTDIFINSGSTTLTNSNNVAIGNQALTFFTTGATYNTAIGYQALYGSAGTPMTGDYNLASGYQAGFSNTTGSYNIFSGYAAGYYNTSGGQNVFLGTYAGTVNTTGSRNNAFGSYAFRGDTFGGPTDMGSDNNAFGTGALGGVISGGITNTGSANSTFGSYSLLNNTTGSGNSALGAYALYNNSTGASSTALGAYAGYTNTTGRNNLYLGDQADSVSTALSNAIAIGSHSQVGASNSMVLGGSGIWNTNIVTGTSTPFAKLSIQNNYGSTTALFDIATTTSATYATSSIFRVGHDGRVSIGSTTPESLGLTINKTGLTGAVIGGVKEYLGFTNTTQSAIYYGDNISILNAPTATSTLVGKVLRITDDTTLGNTVRGMEIQAHRGANTKGENTGISAFGRTFGLRGTTEGDAGDTFVPAGVYAETRGTTQGNALRAYSGSITTSSLAQLFHDTSDFIGTGLLMNFGNTSGSFAATTSAKFFDLQVGGTSKFMVAANGSTTIGDGIVSASLRIPFGGICVDNDGSCISTTTGQIRSVTSALGNSDLAEIYFSSQPLETGEIVALDGGLSVVRGNETNRDHVIGVVSTKPGSTLGYDDTSLRQNETGYPIGLKGRVPVKLSTENGPIVKGDRITLSSISGIGMKATESDIVVGIALEDYDGTTAYSAGYLNQFGDDLVKAKLKPENQNTDARTQDGCSYGAGNEEGETPCVKDAVTAMKTKTYSVDTKTEVLNDLRTEEAKAAITPDGEEVTIGQVIMFIEYAQYMIAAESDILKALNSTSTLTTGDGTETLFDRIKALANAFVDGVLTLTGVKTEEVQTEELCVGAVCVDEATFLRMVEKAGETSNTGATGDSQPDADSDTDTDTDTSESDTDGDSGTSTVPTNPDSNTPDPDPTSDPEVTPEPEVQPEPITDPEPEPEPEPEVTPEPTPEPEPVPPPTTESAV